MGTWTHKTSGTLWLRDLLPKVLPNIRIMTFGYNARFKNFTAQQDLRSIASKLLTELVDLRHSVEVRLLPPSKNRTIARNFVNTLKGKNPADCLCLS